MPAVSSIRHHLSPINPIHHPFPPVYAIHHANGPCGRPCGGWNYGGAPGHHFRPAGVLVGFSGTKIMPFLACDVKVLFTLVMRIIMIIRIVIMKMIMLIIIMKK